MAVYFLWLQNERQNVHIYNQKLQIVNLQNVLEMTHKKLETLESKNNKINVIIPKSQEDLSTIISFIGKSSDCHNNHLIFTLF
jgi:hypothetical protein